MNLRARYFDGVRPQGRDVDLEIESDSISGRSMESSEELFVWLRKDLRRDLNSRVIPLLYSNTAGDARLEVGISFKGLESYLPELVPQRPGIFENVPRVWLIGGASTVLIVVGLVLSLNVIVHQVARKIPFSWEKKYLGHISEGPPFEYCSVTADAQAALDKILGSIYPTYPSDQQFDLRLGVVDISHSNAFALPGGKMAFTKGFVKSAPNPDWLVAVLSHEIAHVEYRHVTAQLIEMAVLQSIANLFSAGEASLGSSLFHGLVASRFSRHAEREADIRGIERLHKSNLRSRGLAEFLKKEDPRIPKFLSHFSSHPEKDERIAYLTERSGDETSYKSLEIPESEWHALKKICDP